MKNVLEWMMMMMIGRQHDAAYSLYIQSCGLIFHTNAIAESEVHFSEYGVDH